VLQDVEVGQVRALPEAGAMDEFEVVDLMMREEDLTEAIERQRKRTDWLSGVLCSWL
jgi:hypothetical protein